MNLIFVLSLIPMINCGIGLNFGMSIGISAVFIGYAFVQLMNIFWLIMPFSNRKMLYPVGGKGLRPKINLAENFGNILNKARGKEMIVSIVVGLLATNIYQLIFMVGYGTIIPNQNKSILLSQGIGVRNMVDIYPI